MKVLVLCFLSVLLFCTSAIAQTQKIYIDIKIQNSNIFDARRSLLGECVTACKNYGNQQKPKLTCSGQGQSNDGTCQHTLAGANGASYNAVCCCTCRPITALEAEVFELIDNIDGLISIE